MKSPFIVSTYYYGLPEFPEKCPIVRDNTLLLRDILACSPNNDHVYLGGQFDPHYEGLPHSSYMKCWPKARSKIFEAAYSGKYDIIYMLFRTCKWKLEGKNEHYICGLYKVEVNDVKLDPNYNGPIITSSDSIFLNSDNSIKLDEFIRYPIYSGGKHSNKLDLWLEEILNIQNNDLSDYCIETLRLKNIFKYYEFDRDCYDPCNNCDEKKCYLKKRIKSKKKLFAHTYDDSTRRINAYYKKLIRIEDFIGK